MSNKHEVTVVADDPLAVLRNEPPLVVEPKTLVEGLRYLQQRIPEYTQLSVAEKRSMLRAASFDPAFIDIGVQAAEAWEDTAGLLGRSAADLRREAEEIRHWEEVERELAVLLKGIAATNLKRKYRLGHSVLRLYNVLRITVDDRNRALRPYVDDLKRAYVGRRRKKKEDVGKE